jgi:3-oxoacyl-[acyl-carrier protein] reductase
MTLKGKTVLITGGSSGIGAAIAFACAAEGARIALASRSRVKLESVADRLPKAEVHLVPGDVGVEDEVVDMVESTCKHFGSIDLLVNNAGMGIFKPLTELRVEDFDTVINTNLRGVFLCTRTVLPIMYEQGSGTIITISSLAGRHGFAGGGAYCASKFGVMGLMESVFHEARSRNVRVITISPGSVDTAFFDEAQTTPPNRDNILRAEDVADTVIFAATLPERALIRELDIRPANPRKG